MSDILQQKKASVERCIKQAREHYARPSDVPFISDTYKQDAVVINLQRACQQCIDMANHTIRLKKLGLPADTAESFTLLKKADVIDDVMEKKLKGMVGFKNTIVHEYQEIDYQTVEDVVTRYADDLIEFTVLLVTLPEMKAVVFNDDEAGYLRWVQEHPRGFVVNIRRNFDPGYVVLHRATCGLIRRHRGMDVSPGGFTERAYLKVCGVSIDDLVSHFKSSVRLSRSSAGLSEPFSQRCSLCKPRGT